MAAPKKPSDGVDPALAKFVEAHIAPKPVPAEKADVSYTIYVSKTEAERIAKIQLHSNLTRQAVLRQLVQSGLVQFGQLTGWWKESS